MKETFVGYLAMKLELIATKQRMRETFVGHLRIKSTMKESFVGYQRSYSNVFWMNSPVRDEIFVVNGPRKIKAPSGAVSMSPRWGLRFPEIAFLQIFRS
jgi:hypothetical protein